MLENETSSKYMHVHMSHESQGWNSGITFRIPLKQPVTCLKHVILSTAKGHANSYMQSRIKVTVVDRLQICILAAPERPVHRTRVWRRGQRGRRRRGRSRLGGVPVKGSRRGQSRDQAGGWIRDVT